ncbi:Lipoprotein [Cupriavidus necator]|uniref:hypothetical protein n=1 Tax=Cupriavidus necator TaxID=106590 RepID=UPI003F741AAB
MMSYWIPRACLPVMLALAVAGCGKEEGHSVAASDALPKACQEAEAAQRACTENMAAQLDKSGQAAAAQTLRDGLPGELESIRTRWAGVSDKDGLAQSCATVRDSFRDMPQCKD